MNDRDIVAMIGEHITLRKKGSRYWGLCSFHHEQTPSFSVDPKLRTWHCFGCREGGDLQDFLKKIKAQK